MTLVLISQLKHGLVWQRELPRTVANAMLVVFYLGILVPVLISVSRLWFGKVVQLPITYHTQDPFEG